MKAARASRFAVSWMVLWLLVVAQSCGGGQDASSGATQKWTGTRLCAQRIEGVQGVDNLAKVTPNLYRGAQPDAEGFQALKNLGIKTVVNLRSYHGEKKEVESLGLRSVEIEVQADILGSTPPTEEDIRLFFQTVLDSKQQPVFVHCAHGKDRTGTMMALYRMEVDGWSADEAVAEMRYFGFHEIYEDLMTFVKQYKPKGYGKK
jgi:tyrosine-protein phosphatase SIW14